MIRAVLDSSVLVSAFLTQSGTSHAVLSAAREGVFVLCLSREILEETRRSLREKVRTIRRYYAYPDERVDQHIAALAEFASDLPELHVVPLDPKDDAIVATAVAARADYLVTGDKRHLLPLGEYEGIKIVTPRQFLDLLAGKGA
jgi:uncharacterized protein